MTKEPLLVCTGDEVWSAGGTLPEFARPDRYRGPLPPYLVERPSERTELSYGGRAFRVATRIDDCHGVLRSVYGVHGSKGLANFFRENNFVPKRHPGARPDMTQEPEQFLSGPRLDAYRLFREAARELEAGRVDVLPKVMSAAQAIGKERLRVSREEVELQVVRYYRSTDARHAIEVLDSDFLPLGDLLDETAAAVKGLRAELRGLAPFIRRAGDAQEAWQRELGRRLIQLERERSWLSRLGPVEAADAREQQFQEQAEQQIRARFPEVAQLQALAKEQRQALILQLTAAAAEHPVLWRIYTMSADGPTTELGRAVLGELRTTWAANRELHANLSDDAELVWRLSPLVRDALATAGVPLYSVAWTASEERMEEETGLRAAAVVSMTAGFAQLGVAGLALLTGGTLAPPIGVVLLAVESVSSLVDAAQEYRAYRLQSAAFRACLDPGQALAVEPSLFSTVMTIGFDLLTLLPPGRAARAVP